MEAEEYNQMRTEENEMEEEAEDLGEDKQNEMEEEAEAVDAVDDMRFDMDEDFKKAAVFKQMGCLWRASKSRLTSQAFKVVSDSYKERRQNQIPHTCGRKGMVRLREDLVKSSEDPSKVSRLRVWVKSRTKKDGTPVNVNAAEKIRKASEIELEGHADSTTTNPKNDMLSQILGPDQPGRFTKAQ
ncbi:PREDICTED: uncharacterized protein LOC106297744 [Brassica oleracea var. oleracea]|uniref:uncharacterized protein LOC106297744 n=1 Tax=Brassica oleracea var. oleracea TaxID=109376 RepID=UPI0006A6D52A|nr:PREDICTED: uncharacterized protein LOC106297744 [Brassica oleracea var. oleracea]